MSNNAVNFNCKRKQLIIKIKEQMDLKDVVVNLRKRMPEIRHLYRNIEPIEISVIGSEIGEKGQKVIRRIVGKYFKAEVKFTETEILGLYGIRKPFQKEIASSETKFYRHSLRSGQKLEYTGSIVVLGDVHFGAEVIAGENIIVLGTLRGLAHAGAKGNKEAIISAGSIETTQVRISNIIRNCEKDEFENVIIKTNAYVDKDDKIVID